MAKRALILLEGTSTGTGLLYAKAAQHLGLHPITLSADPTRYDYLAAEKIEVLSVDTADLKALIRVCCQLRETYGIAGITSANESVYAKAGELCAYFRLPGPNATSIQQCCDKFAQRQLLAGAGVSVPAFRLAATAMDIKSAAAEIGLPVVLKPAVGIGSIGVRLCRSFEELAEHTTYLLGGKHIWRSPPRILVEEYAQGAQYAAEIMGNEVIGVEALEFGDPPHFVYREFTFPALLTDEEHERIVDVSRACLRALGLGWGPANIEFRWTKLGPVVIEVNPRLAGAPDPQLVAAAYGIDLVTEHIKLVTGSKWNLDRRHSLVAAARFLLPDRDGTLDWIAGASQAASLPGIAEVKLYFDAKARIVRTGDYRDSIGYVLAVSPSLVQTEAILQRAVDLIEWSITPSLTRGE